LRTSDDRGDDSRCGGTQRVSMTSRLSLDVHVGAVLAVSDSNSGRIHFICTVLYHLRRKTMGLPRKSERTVKALRLQIMCDLLISVMREIGRVT
jgi:hypothetical protein